MCGSSRGLDPAAFRVVLLYVSRHATLLLRRLVRYLNLECIVLACNYSVQVLVYSIRVGNPKFSWYYNLLFFWFMIVFCFLCGAKIHTHFRVHRRHTGSVLYNFFSCLGRTPVIHAYQSCPRMLFDPRSTQILITATPR